jgi:hypothetical protein
MTELRRCREVLLVCLGAAITLAAISVAGCGSAGSMTATGAIKEPIKRTVRVRPVHWAVASVLAKQTVRIGAQMGECDGAPKPRIFRIEIKEHRNRQFITVYGRFVRVHSKDSFCFDSLTMRYREIHLSKPLVELQLYDASTMPASRRWPYSS